VNGYNVLMLWTAALAQSFAGPIWMTFNQARELKASVRKGARGSLVRSSRMRREAHVRFLGGSLLRGRLPPDKRALQLALVRQKPALTSEPEWDKFDIGVRVERIR
jgi:hypothetical protein